jgi:F-type H+-transporting ATPase subunit alpha
LTEILKQGQYRPMSVEEQVTILWAATNGHTDDIPVDRVRAFEDGLLEYMRSAHGDLLKRIATEKEIKPDLADELKKAVTNFKSGSDFSSRPLAAAAR